MREIEQPWNDGRAFVEVQAASFLQIASFTLRTDDGTLLATASTSVRLVEVAKAIS